MALRSNDWLRLHDLLRVPLGEEAADKLMEFLPPTGFGDVATKEDLRRDLALLSSDLRREIADLHTELRSEMADLRLELRGDIGDLRADMNHLRADLHDELRRQTMWFIGVMAPMLVGGMALAAAITH